MADPISILGATASVVQIIDVLVRSVSTINSLTDQWKDADIALLSFTTQLITLKAAIEEIRDWMEINSHDLHHQLVMDLDGAIQCCKVLTDRIDRELQSLGAPTLHGRLGFTSRSRILMKGKKMTDIQKMIETQTSALMLLLMACNSKTLGAQCNTLSQTSTRKIFTSMKQDSASLIVLYDDASMITSWSDNLSKLSAMFDFDAELFASKVYASVIRNPLKLSLLSRRKGWAPGSAEEQAAATSKAIDDMIFAGSEQKKQERKILLLGIGDASKTTIIKQMCHLHGFLMSQEHSQWRKTIHAGIFQAVKWIVMSIMEKMNLEDLETESFKSKSSITRILESDWDDDGRLLSDVKQLLEDTLMRRRIDSPTNTSLRDHLIGSNFDYFLSSFDRIYAADYVPSNCDILHAKVSTLGVTETTLSKHFRVYDCGGRRHCRMR
ncbi:G-protein alpha subunit-domain-containing protein [Lophiotrema nucula]|uniref:G-protein alpha subunit-domain-containing protein n=1 Tax=Lophiotrema nucula TaxID=690887 RepID=A0A6A5YPE4_9PLEO|nr:G-protein alpha subunit-domain-containing protein [Lophiotrema nucula]